MDRIIPSGWHASISPPVMLLVTLFLDGSAEHIGITYQDKVLTLGNPVKKSLIEVAIHKIVLVKTDGISVSFQQVINMASCLVTAIAAVADENVVDY